MGVFWGEGLGCFPMRGGEGAVLNGKRYPASPDDIPALRAGTISEPAAQTISAARTGGEEEVAATRLNEMQLRCMNYALPGV